MKSSWQAIVHGVLAWHLDIDPIAIDDTQRLDQDLGLDAFDMALLGLRLEARAPGHGDIPMATLVTASTVGELTSLFTRWFTGELESNAIETTFVSDAVFDSADLPSALDEHTDQRDSFA